MSVVKFFVPMKPEAKQADRSRIAKMKDGREFIAHYKDSKVKKAELWIAQNAMRSAPLQPLEGPLFAIIRAYSAPATSYSDKKKKACLSAELWPTGRPDVDNLCKMVLDALGTSKLFFHNDSQFVFVLIIKQYAEREGVEFTCGNIKSVDFIREFAKVFRQFYAYSNRWGFR